ncbi:MAG TPA: hypothetical protein VE685_17465, partial [Thermoanaerobaculia bacterium]|nr:hypothetical protein [Thermoanaerobaculia bacterium]
MSTGRRGALVCLLLALSALRPFPAAAEDFVIFGPVRYERSTGQPGLSTATFNVPEPLAPVSLRLVNGDAAGARRVSSAEIWVNGAMVLGPRDFNQRVSHLIVPLHGLDLRNSLWIRIASGPAAFLTLEVTTPFAPATPPVTPVLDTYTAATAADAVTLTGTSRRAVTLEVSAPTGVLSVPVASGAFRAEVPLRADSLNQIFLTGISAAGVRSAPAAAAITQDGQAPHLFVDYPSEGSLLANDAVDVAGRVGDMLSGRLGLAVSVNGVPASVGLGVGSDGTFVARGVPLRSGEPTVLTATATDALGN